MRIATGPLSRCLSILIYHRVIAEPDPLLPGLVCARDFDWHLAVLGRWFKPLALAEAIARLHSGTLPARAACVTFDDGYEDNVTVALPILRRHGIPATFFVATGFLNSGRMWNDTIIDTVRLARGGALDARRIGLDVLPISTLQERRAAVGRLISALKYLPLDERLEHAETLRARAEVELGDGLMMTRDQLRALRGHGMEVGAHTVNHPILAKLDEEAAFAEIRNSKTELEAVTGSPVRLFAYPNGKPGRDYRSEHVDMVRRLGFAGAVSTAMGVGIRSSDCYQLPRFTPWDRTPTRFLLRLLRNTFRTSALRV